MKKLLKLTLIVLLIISLAFVVTGCGNKENASKVEENGSKVEENNEQLDNAKSKTYTLLSSVFSGDDYVFTLEGKTDIGQGTEDATITMAIKGEKIYMDVDAASSHLGIMYKDNTTYIISHDDKMYMTYEGKSEEMFNEEDMVVLSKEDLKELENTEYETGKETINGTEYEYEEYKDDESGTIERYYFSGNDLIYIKSINDGEEELMKIVKLSSEVDDSIFEIPSNYEKVEE